MKFLLFISSLVVSDFTAWALLNEESSSSSSSLPIPVVEDHPKYHRALRTHVINDEYVVILKKKKGGDKGVYDTLRELIGPTSDGIIETIFPKLHGAAVSNLTPEAKQRLLQSEYVVALEENQKTVMSFDTDEDDTDEVSSTDDNTEVNDVNDEHDDEPFQQNITGTNVLWGLDRIDPNPTDGYYNYGLTGEGVDVYVLDTGLRSSHNEYEGRASCPISFVEGESCSDKHSHGTHCAGIIGSKTYGVAKKVNLIGVKVLSNSGEGNTKIFAYGIDWVISRVQRTSPNRRAVISISLGTPTVSPTVNTAIYDAVNNGIFMSAAAGNSGVDACIGSPGSSKQAMVVGAVDKWDMKPWWSNYGRCLDIFAPGVNVYSTDKDHDTDMRSKSGTSMASPFVAGAAALYLQDNPDATPKQVKEALEGMARSKTITNGGDNSPNRLLQIPKSSKPHLEFRRKWKASYSYQFRILQLTDLHFGESESMDSSTWDIIGRMIKYNYPHLIVLSGDLISADSIDATTGKDALTYYEELAAYLEKRGVPWAFTFGDTDVTSTSQVSRETLVKADRRHRLSLTKLGPDGISGTTNYYIDVHIKGKPATRVFMFDTGGGDRKREIEQSQVDWFNSNNDPSIPAMAFQHVPSYPSYFQFDKAHCSGLKMAKGVRGVAWDAGLFNTMAASGNVQVLGTGHNHGMGYCCKYSDSFNYCFGRRTGFGGTEPWYYKGARVYHLHADSEGNLMNWHSYVRLSWGDRVDNFDPTFGPLTSSKLR